MRHKQKNNIGLIAYTNFSLTAMKAMLVLLLAAVALMAVKIQPSDGIKPNAQYIIEMSWADDYDTDVDLWVRAPGDQLIFYTNRETPMVFLDRDDTGIFQDTVIIDGKVINSKSRKEIVSIRGILPGEYVINGFLYRYWSRSPQYEPLDSYATRGISTLPRPLKVKVEVKKLNPTVEIVYSETLQFTQHKEELFFCRFTVGQDGLIKNVNTRLPTSLVAKVYKDSDIIKPKGVQ